MFNKGFDDFRDKTKRKSMILSGVPRTKSMIVRPCRARLRELRRTKSTVTEGSKALRTGTVETGSPAGVWGRQPPALFGVRFLKKKVPDSLIYVVFLKKTTYF